MSIPFTTLVSLKPGRIDWKVKFRVTRMWKEESSFFRGQVSSIEMILLDLDVSLFSMQRVSVTIDGVVTLPIVLGFRFVFE